MLLFIEEMGERGDTRFIHELGGPINAHVGAINAHVGEINEAWERHGLKVFILMKALKRHVGV